MGGKICPRHRSCSRDSHIDAPTYFFVPIVGVAVEGPIVDLTFGNWHTIHVRLNRWAKTGILKRLATEL